MNTENQPSTAIPVGWDPRTEDELALCARIGLLEETHRLDIKRELESGNSANKKLANDIAAFALDGGIILIGVDEDTSPPSLSPVRLDGLAERIEQIARMRVEEAVQIRTTEIESSTNPGHGYLVVHVPASVRAPHMADGRYYGRGDKTNRVLSNTEVVRLLDGRLADRRDLRAEASAIRADLVGTDIPLFVAVADPLGAPEELLVSLTEDPQWHSTAMEVVQATVTREHHLYAPTLAQPSGFARRADGVAITTGMLNGNRFEGNDHAAEVVFTESGRLILASERAVTTWSFRNVMPPPPDAKVVFETLILGHLSQLARLAAVVSKRWGFTGSWRLALSINGLRDAMSLTLAEERFGDRGTVYTADLYERATEASLADLHTNPNQIVATLASPLLRSLGSYPRWANRLTTTTTG